MEAVIRLVAIRCADKRGISNEENDDGPGLCHGTAVISRDGPGTRRRCGVGRGFGCCRAWAGGRGGRCFCRLCGRAVYCELLGIAAITLPQTGPQARTSRAGRRDRRKRVCFSNPYGNGCIAPTCSCSIAATCAKGRDHNAAGAAAGMRAFADVDRRVAGILS